MNACSVYIFISIGPPGNGCVTHIKWMCMAYVEVNCLSRSDLLVYTCIILIQYFSAPNKNQNKCRYLLSNHYTGLK